MSAPGNSCRSTYCCGTAALSQSRLLAPTQPRDEQRAVIRKRLECRERKLCRRLIIYISQPNWHVPLGMKHAPDIHMGLEFKVAHKTRESIQPYGPHTGSAQRMRPPPRPCRQPFPDEAIALFKCINEAESHDRQSTRLHSR